jgi:hypothetical protein
MKNYVLNIQELYDFTKRPKYLSWALKKKGVQTKSIRSIFNKIIAKNSPNLQKEMLIQVQETCRTPNRQDQNTISPWHIIVKTLSTENKERLKLQRISAK